MTSPYCQLCGFQPPDPVAYHERTVELAAAREEIRRLRGLVHLAYGEGGMDAGSEYRWQDSAVRSDLGPDAGPA